MYIHIYTYIFISIHIYVCKYKIEGFRVQCFGKQSSLCAGAAGKHMSEHAVTLHSG